MNGLPRPGRLLAGSLAALLVLVAGGAFLARDNLFRHLIEPRVPFQVDEPPPAPDYRDASAWAARPQGPPLPGAGEGPDIFFVHPTTYEGGAQGWNSDPRDPEARAALETVALPNHAGPFAAAGRLWAPAYRQAALFAMLASRTDTHDALDLAYGDVARAFDAFQAGRPAGAPFVVAGVGQGGLHVLRLLQDRLASAPARAGLVAVYVIDQPVGGRRADGLVPCTGPAATDCLIAWTEADAGARRERELKAGFGFAWQPGAGYVRLGSEARVCVNPLTGGAAPSAPATLNPGSAAATGLEPGMAPPLLRGETGARCAGGMLLVDPGRPSSLTPPRFELGAAYRTPGYNLFYAAIEADVRTRTRALISRSGP